MAQPETIFRLANISASVFKNETQGRTFHNVVLQRSYQDGEETKYTNTLNIADLPSAAALLHLVIARYVDPFHPSEASDDRTA